MIPKDKLLHILAGAGITLALSLVLPMWVAFMLACVAGFAKEVYDDLHPLTHTCDGLDFLATVAGALSCWLILIGLT